MAAAMAEETACPTTKEVNSGQENLATSNFYIFFGKSWKIKLPRILVGNQPLLVLDVQQATSHREQPSRGTEDMPQKERDAIMQQPPGFKNPRHPQLENYAVSYMRDASLDV